MTQIPSLTTDRLILRAPSNADFEPMAEFYATEHSRFVGGPMTPELAWRSLAQEAGHWLLLGFGRWSVVEQASGKWVGTVGLWHPEGFPENELGWDLAEHATGKGYATEAARAARTYAYDTLGWTTLISLVHVDNAASEAVARRLGAEQDGLFEHERYGPLRVFRHPSPEALA